MDDREYVESSWTRVNSVFSVSAKRHWKHDVQFHRLSCYDRGSLILTTDVGRYDARGVETGETE